MASSHLVNAQPIPADSIYGIAARAKADPAPVANLVIGAYRDENGKPWILPSVAAAKAAAAADDTVIHEYLPIRGDTAFTAAAARFIFGADSPVVDSLVSVQTLSGTGALRVLAELFKILAPAAPIYLPDPTWGNHVKVLSRTNPDADIRTYRYFDAATRGLDADGMLADLRAARKAPSFSSTCAPTTRRWEAIRDVCLERGLFPWFDAAYQGFASGDPDADAASLRLFAAAGIDLVVAQSFAKSAGLYGERVGAAHVLTHAADARPALMTQLEGIIRPMYSSPPRYFASVVTRLLTTPEITTQWLADLKTMSARVVAMRHALHDALVAAGTPGDWSHIVNQIGMFSYTGLTRDQAESLMADHHVYLLHSGRISMSGLNASNVNAVAAAIHAVVTATPSSNL
ncbi:aspartate aminotransferase [Thecamonas trahens ATCC 50062]|uniref:Aspartate aminotransferase n=1 Tax=Thecamonas trahens ATCC 50062 TaxID=461836 RepID=A0A0L0D3W8_THETB|nr:aspartate aminotransferase [Thecamonas trahens ATCC 50062]KNC47052.1 aspartate aminotransferase [Thecamonas trahens ATCC 50062]|eukprot:XP_013759832.1 aspartate aminotransferase [Thecamonas trahens ATCC 50062]